MKRVLTFLFASILLLNCDNTLYINDDYKVTPVVYGILDQNADSQFVRLHRTYLGEEGIAAGFNEADSLYFDTATLYLKELNQDGSQRNLWVMQEISAQMDSGVYTADQHRLYATNAPISAQYNYKLTGFIPGQDNFTATTPVVGDFDITKPKGFQKISFGIRDADFSWDAAKNAIIYQGYIIFRYKEAPRNNPLDSTIVELVYALPMKTGTSTSGSGSFTTSLSYDAYFRFLRNNIGTSTTMVRVFKGIDVEVFAGADDLATYINVNQPSTGIVQEKPLFTNVEGGIGLFSSRTSQRKVNVSLSASSLDSLWRGNLTCDMGWLDFQGIDSCICVNGEKVCF